MTDASPTPNGRSRALHPLVWAATAAAVLAALGSLGRDESPPEAPVAVAPTPLGADGLPTLCGPRTIPDGPICVPIPSEGERAGVGSPREPAGRDQIPRRPERAANYGAYAFPISAAGKPVPVTTKGLREDAAGLLLRGEAGQEVHLLDLENQEGPATVAFVAELDLGAMEDVRESLVLATKHLVREAGQLRSYLVVYGNLASVGGGVVTGARLTQGQLLGSLANDEAGASLYFELRQLRGEVALAMVTPAQLLDATRSIPCDARNLLPTLAP